MPETLVAVVPGAALIVLVAWDVLLTLLHPTARGPLSYAVNRITWSAARATSIRLLRRRGLAYAGPLAVATNVLAWVFALWVGFALVYLPFADSITYAASVPRAEGIPAALYLSGAALTTVGFGDVVATGNVLRLVTTMEAASGFGVLSAAIAFVLSIYPLISQMRSTGIHLTDAGALELEGATRVAREAGPSELAATVHGLTENHEHLRRFPVLYYFESGNPEESLSAVVRASSLLLVSLHCLPTADVPHKRVYCQVLERSLLRLLDDLDRDFVGGRRRTLPEPDVDPKDAEIRMTALCGKIVPQGDRAGEHDPGRARLGVLLARAETVLEAFAEEHGQTARRLLPE
ncbi:MAG: potassium channel family protein [Actinomycetota bacterium]|nr:potassium channel family protein [Actinomycetota bacterium]